MNVFARAVSSAEERVFRSKPPGVMFIKNGAVKNERETETEGVRVPWNNRVSGIAGFFTQRQKGAQWRDSVLSVKTGQFCQS